MCDNFILYATYSSDMNLRIYQAARKMTEAQVRLPRGAFFGSVLGTLNHLIVADTIWLYRIAHHPAEFPSLSPVKSWFMPKALDQTVVEDLESWWNRRCSIDRTIKEFVSEIKAEDLETYLHYTSIEGTSYCRPLKTVLLHFFNHHTHHRGQITTLMTQSGVDVGATDLLNWVPSRPSYVTS